MKPKEALFYLDIAREYAIGDQELYKLITDEMNNLTVAYDEDDEDDEYDLSLTIIHLMSKARRIK